MSSDGICIAITHAGARCTSSSTNAAGHCAHHARIARVMALAPKASATSSPKAQPLRASSSSALRVTAPVGIAPVQPPYTATAHVSSVEATTQPYTSILQTSPLLASTLAATTAPSAASPSSRPSSSTSSSLSSSHSQQAWMLPSESLLATVNASFVFPQALALPTLPGSLFVTNLRLKFEPLNAALRSPGHLHRLLDDAIEGIARACVAKLSYPQSLSPSRSKHELPTQLIVKFKDLRAWTLAGEINTLMTTLNRHVFVDSPLSLFAFVPTNNARSSADDQRELQGHRIFDLNQDFARMGVDFRGSAYRVTDVNRSYAVCATYAQQFVVPSVVSDAEVSTVAEFRSKGRLPICCYAHSRNEASIWRCAQPKRGIFNAQNAADERYLARIAQTNRNQPKMWIADCRPELNARVNNLTGGGTESSSLQHATLTFLNIANIHAMRESLDSVRSLMLTANQDLDFSWLARVEETKWLLHVRLVLSAAVRVADSVENKHTTVLVHCSDGWDRTGQLCALSQILLDRHYRTMLGFMQIVEKEWILPGHKFHDRIGPGKAEHDEQSPIFLQFLDCVWQLWRQYPTYFEFNAKFLEEIADALFSGRYGTFLGNCDRERTTWNAYTRTPSLWAHLLRHREQFTNPFYREQSEMVLIPKISSLLRNAVLWQEYYFRGTTFDTIPHGNTCPPAWGITKTSARNNQQDLADAMGAALLKVQELEQELISLRSKGVVGAPTAAPDSTVPMTVGLPPAPIPAPPSVESYSHPVPTHSANSFPGTWSCSICAKVNALEHLKCLVCGRPPPPVAATTQL